MGIFGTGAPKFVSGATTVLLDNAIITKDEPDFRMLEHTAEIDQTKFYSGKGYHWDFHVKINLYKQTNPDTIFTTLMSYLHTEVTLFRHRDGISVRNSANAVVPFFLTEVIPKYKELLNFNVEVILKFRSTEMIDITKSLV